MSWFKLKVIKLYLIPKIMSNLHKCLYNMVETQNGT